MRFYLLFILFFLGLILTFSDFSSFETGIQNKNERSKSFEKKNEDEMSEKRMIRILFDTVHSKSDDMSMQGEHEETYRFLKEHEELRRKSVMTEAEKNRFKSILENRENYKKAILVLEKTSVLRIKTRLYSLNFLLSALREPENTLKEDLSVEILKFLRAKRKHSSSTAGKNLIADKVELIQGLLRYDADLVRGLEDESDYFTRLVSFAKKYGAIQ